MCDDFSPFAKSVPTSLHWRESPVKLLFFKSRCLKNTKFILQETDRPRISHKQICKWRWPLYFCWYVLFTKWVCKLLYSRVEWKNFYCLNQSVLLSYLANFWPFWPFGLFKGQKAKKGQKIKFCQMT